ncbi:hypothetical protein ACJ41P_32335 [Azospirillum argentinense]|uniref:Tyr recombinase domain-containing protein n=1 Tax=Azospirillum argentinense TaxID=2970906 RepID=A0ABW8VKJ6_9PROT
MKLRFMGAGFILGGRPCSGYPVLQDDTGRVVEIVADYFAFRALRRGASSGTLRNEAYVLLDWWRMLERNCSWDEATDSELERWAGQCDDRGLTPARTVRRVGVVHAFYVAARRHFGAPERLVQLEADVQSGTPRQLSSQLRHSGRRGDIPALGPAYRPRTVTKRPGRPTPEPDEVQRVLDALLEGPHRSDYVGIRDCLLAGWMEQCGLRREGAVGVGPGALARALATEGVRDDDGPYDLVAGTDAAHIQDAVFAGLRRLRQMRRSHVFVSVTEKRRKTRSVPVPLGFLEINLQFLWEPWTEAVAALRASRPDYAPPDRLFLSLKTGRALLPGSAGDIVKDAFSSAGVDGSGHRLRAAFALRVVKTAYLEQRARHGRFWDPAAVLLYAAEVLGHENMETLRPYLNAIVREGIRLQGEPILIQDHQAAAIFRSLANAVNQGRDGVLASLASVLRGHGLVPEPELDTLERLAKALGVAG